MKKVELIKAVQEQYVGATGEKMSRDNVATFLNCLEGVIIDALAVGDTVKVLGAKFEKVHVEATQRKNLQTKEMFECPEHDKVKVKATKVFRDIFR